MTGLLTVLKFWQTLLFVDHHAVSPECKHPAALRAPEGCAAIEGEEKEGKLQFC